MTPTVIWAKLIANKISGRGTQYGSWTIARLIPVERSCTLARGTRQIGVHCIPVAYNGIDGWVQEFRWFGDPTDEEIAEIVLLV